MFFPKSIKGVQEVINVAPTSILIRGGGTKTGLSRNIDNVTVIDLSNLSGIVEYRPEEFTFTALSGTRLIDIVDLLSKNGQWMPFDPPMANKGSTLGGVLATGLSGPCRYGFGGIRDFVLGIRWISGTGDVLNGGSRVVKNVAGFDFPKLMVGSLGRFGVITEVTMKVFPKLQDFGTVEWNCGSIEDSVKFAKMLTLTSIDLLALDIESDGFVRARIGGLSVSLQKRLDRLSRYKDNAVISVGSGECGKWDDVRDFEWVDDDCLLIKVPITPDIIPVLDSKLNVYASVRKYSVGGNIAWIGWKDSVKDLDKLLMDLGLAGLIILGEHNTPWLGASAFDTVFADKVKRALDPYGKFLLL